MNEVKKLTLFLLVVAYVGGFGLFFQPSTVFAGPIQETFEVNTHLRAPGQGEAEDSYLKIAKERGISPVAAFVVDLIDFLAKLIGAVALLVFVVGAVLTIVSEGADDRLQKGKQAMIYSLVGVAIAFCAFLIVTFVQSIFY